MVERDSNPILQLISQLHHSGYRIERGNAIGEMLIVDPCTDEVVYRCSDQAYRRDPYRYVRRMRSALRGSIQNRPHEQRRRTQMSAKTMTQLDNAAAQLAAQGHTITTFRTGQSPRWTTDLRRSFNDLAPDPYSDRLRAFCRMAQLDGLLRDRPYEAYFEAANAAVGHGVERYFPPLDAEVQANPALRSCVGITADLYRAATGATGVIEIGVHQVRVVAKGVLPGEVTPEGIHQDGNTAFAAILFNRYCVGAETIIYDQDKREVNRHTLTGTLDAVVAIDHRIWHNVTPIALRPGSRDGFRDILIVDIYDAEARPTIAERGTNDSRPASIRQPVFP